MNINVLNYFIAVAEYRNFTKAAEALFVTQPTLSRQIDMLEKEFGMKFFIRNSHSVSLTPAGAVFLEEAKDVVRRYQKMKLRMESVKRGISQTLNVGYTRTIYYDILARSLRSIGKKYPKIEVSLICNDSAELFNNLYSGNLDVIFTLRLEKIDINNIVWQKAGEGELRCIVNDEHSLANAKTIGIEDLRNERILLPARPNCSMLYDYIYNLFRRKEIEPDILQIEEMQNIRFLVKSGLGIALLPECRDESKTNGVKSITLKESSHDFDIIVARKADNKNPSIQMLINEIDIFEQNDE